MNTKDRIWLKSELIALKAKLAAKEKTFEVRSAIDQLSRSLQKGEHTIEENIQKQTREALTFLKYHIDMGSDFLQTKINKVIQDLN
jgi:hypothetical protein